MRLKGTICVSVFAILLSMYPMAYNYFLNDPSHPALGDPKDLSFKLSSGSQNPTVYVKVSGPFIIKFSLCNDGILPVRVPRYSGIGSTIDINLMNTSHEIVLEYPTTKMARGAEFLTTCQETELDISWISGHYNIINSTGQSQRLDFSWNVTGMYTLKGVYRHWESGIEIDSNELRIRIID
jgi:hypothetical protein